MLRNNLKLAWRSLIKNKSYTLLNIAGLSVGLAGALLIFLIINFHLSTDSYHKKKDRVYRLVSEMVGPGSDFKTSAVPHPIATALRMSFPQLEQVAMVDEVGGTISIKDKKNKQENLFDGSSENSKINMAYVEPSYFKILDHKWLSGNPNQALSKPNSVVLTKSMAIELFHTSQAMGKILTLEHELDLIVTGIIADNPLNTSFPFNLLISYNTQNHLGVDANEFLDWGSQSSNTSCLVLLKSTSQLSQVESRFPNLIKNYYTPEDARGRSFKLQSLKEIRFDGSRGNYGNINFPWSLMLSLGSIGIVLLLTASINFINLSTSISSKRAKEVGIKKVLGSLPASLFWQFITETAVITFFACAISIVIVILFLPFLSNFFNAPVGISSLVHIDFIFFISLLFFLMVALSGYYPGKILSGFQPLQALKSQVTVGSTRGFTLRKILVIIQFSISQIMLISTLIMISQLHFIHTAKLGFQKNGLYMVSLPLTLNSKAKLFKNRLQEIKDISSVSLSFVQPMSNFVGTTNFNYDKRAKDEKFGIDSFSADSSYLGTYGIRLICGRNLKNADSIKEYLVNETWVKQMGIKDPHLVLGKNLRVHHMNAPIVGVVKDFHTSSLKNKIPPIYIATEKDRVRVAGIKVNMSNILETKASIESIWKSIYPGFIFQASSFDEQIAKMYEDQEKFSQIISCFAIIAIVIGCLGLFGLISYTTINKTKEIGIRKVLGATVTEIVLKLLSEFGLLLLIGFLISGPVAFLIMNNWLHNFEFRIVIKPYIFIFSLGISCLITFLTISLKTIQAATANPVKSLRTE